MSKRISVIGGGVAGLCSAIRLAHMGYRVSLYEKNRSLGGKMNRLGMQDYLFDTGPSLITMPFVLKELFEFCGRNIEDYVELIAVDPVCRYFYPNGLIFDAWSDRKKMIAELDEHFPGQVKNFERFIKYSRRIYKKTADVFLFSPIHEWHKLINARNLLTLMQIYHIDPLRTVHQSVSRFIDHPYLVQLFDRYATYNGSNPFQAPATLNIIPYVEYDLKSFYIRDGIYSLTQALVRLAEQVGVSLYTDVKVEKILQKQKRVTGIQAGNERIDADAVLCNADVVMTYNELLSGVTRQSQKLNQLEPSLSGMVFSGGLKKDFRSCSSTISFFPTIMRLNFTRFFSNTSPLMIRRSILL